jgi:hypothetical protein
LNNPLFCALPLCLGIPIGSQHECVDSNLIPATNKQKSDNGWI